MTTDSPVFFLLDQIPGGSARQHHAAPIRHAADRQTTGDVGLVAPGNVSLLCLDEWAGLPGDLAAKSISVDRPVSVAEFETDRRVPLAPNFVYSGDSARLTVRICEPSSASLPTFISRSGKSNCRRSLGDLTPQEYAEMILARGDARVSLSGTPGRFPGRPFWGFCYSVVGVAFWLAVAMNRIDKRAVLDTDGTLVYRAWDEQFCDHRFS